MIIANIVVQFEIEVFRSTVTYYVIKSARM